MVKTRKGDYGVAPPPPKRQRLSENSDALHDRIDALTTELNTTRTSRDELQTSRDELQTSRDELQNRNDALATRLDTIRTSRDDLQIANDELRISRDELRGQNNDLSAELVDVRRSHANLEDQNHRLSTQVDTFQNQGSTSRNTGIQPGLAPQPAAPQEMRDYYAEPVTMLNPPDKNIKAQMDAFYIMGGSQHNGTPAITPGASLGRFETYRPTRPIPRPATPEPQSRRNNIGAGDLDHRQYFEVKHEDHLTATSQYGLIEEQRAGSGWAGTTTRGINKAPVRHYSENMNDKLAAAERWARLNIVTGVKTNPPRRFDPRTRGDGNGR